MSHKRWVLPGALVLAARAGPGVPSGQQSWRCEHGIDFRVRFVDDSALLEGPRTRELLFRDAGGQGPQQTVYSNAKMRAEFGLGANGREARLSYPALPLMARCVRD
ncbi:MAG: hypothetical protein Q7T13_03870 [Polaromonas sp.]|nr:hypothetical protein [Polaromonas sp.]